MTLATLLMLATQTADWFGLDGVEVRRPWDSHRMQPCSYWIVRFHKMNRHIERRVSVREVGAAVAPQGLLRDLFGSMAREL